MSNFVEKIDKMDRGDPGVTTGDSSVRLLPEQLKTKGRQEAVCNVRKAVVRLGRKHCGSTVKELASAPGISEAAVSQLLVKSLEGFEEIDNLITLA